jgi:o-succinylbenzoate synthase
MYKATIHPYKLIFKEPGGTSRGVLTTKMSYFIHVWKDESPDIMGIGECSILPGLSPDDRPELEEKLQQCCEDINQFATSFHDRLKEWPAIQFALEMAFLDLEQGGKQVYYQSEFTNGTKGIAINGLIWMGNIDQMSCRIEEKLADGYKCLKLKIGATHLVNELNLLTKIREQYSPETLEIRVDANGAFSMTQAPIVLEKLAKLSIHSIEQPIKAGNWDEMALLCASTPIPIALDEELIGINEDSQRKKMLSTIKPHYIILKPSLTGGFSSSENWIKNAEAVNTGWWVTSALESNIGLNAIAQWTATLNNQLPQGLGTGQVFTNNIQSQLMVEKGVLKYMIASSF